MILRLTNHVYIESDEDPQDVAASFSQGAESALRHFPSGEVIHVEVDAIREATQEELEEHGLVE